MNEFGRVFGGNIGDPIRDPYSVYAMLRAEAPCRLFEGTVFGDMYFVTPYTEVRRILETPRLFSSGVNNRLIGSLIGPTIVGMDEPDHNRVRKIIMPFFTPRPVGALKDRIRAIALEMTDQFAGEEQADLVEQFTFTFPLAAFDRLMLGVEVEDAAQLHAWVRSFLKLTTNPGEAVAAMFSIKEYLGPVIDEARRKGEGDTLLQCLTHAEVHGERLSDAEIMSFLILLLQAGAETTFGLLGSAIASLLENDLWQGVRDDRTLLENVFQETLRYEAPVQFVAREATEDVEIGGVSVPKGAFMVAVIGSANRDIDAFHDAGRFDLSRTERYWDPVLAFGLGPHFCAGAHLAKMEFMMAMNVLLDHFPNLRLDDTQSYEGVVGFPFRAPRSLHVLLGG